jgi:hypothetical protein
MVERIKETRTETEQSPSGAETPKKRDFGTNIMIAVVIAILIGIVFAYIATFKDDFDFSLKSITANGGLLLLACFSVRYLCKHISINKARQTEEYLTARTEAEDATKAIVDKGYSRRIPEYTKAYSERKYAEALGKILKNARISEAEYFDKYATKSKREILSDFPHEKLSKKQWKAVRLANSVKLLHYDEKFLETTIEKIGGYVSPSDAFDVEREDKRDDARSLLMSVAFALFSCSLAGTIIFDLSRQALLLAVIKIITTLISAAFAVSAGWKLVMRKEISRFRLQKTEANNCIQWCEKHPEEDEKDEP